MSEDADIGATIDGTHRLLAQSLAPELERQRAMVEEFAEDARALREGLRGRFERARSRVEPLFDAAETGLVNVDRRLEQAAHFLDAWGDQRLSQIGSTKDATVGLRNDVHQRFVAIGDDLTAGGEAAAAGAEAAEKLLETLRAALAEAIESVGAVVAELEGGLDAGQQEASARLQDAQTKLTAFTDQCARTLDDLIANAHDRSQSTEADVERMLDDSQSAVEQLRSDAEDILGRVNGAAEKVNQLFGDGSQSILGQVKELMAIVEKIRPLLDAVEQWT